LSSFIFSVTQVELSEYEKFVVEKRKRNQEYLEQLGLESVSKSLSVKKKGGKKGCSTKAASTTNKDGATKTADGAKEDGGTKAADGANKDGGTKAADGANKDGATKTADEANLDGATKTTDGANEDGGTKTVDGDDEAVNTPCIAEVSLYSISFTLFAESIF
jgi:hypothetical protein